MHVNLRQYTGPCRCGKSHSLLTQEIILETGAAKHLPAVAAALGLHDRGTVLCDTNTLPFAQSCAGMLEGRLCRENGVAVLDAAGLHADEKAVAAAEKKLPADVGWLLAVGAGTIHDITRYIAHKRGIPFLSFPTAASVDGFSSAVSAMTWYGFKKTLPGVPPLAIVADTDIFAAAPHRLTASGVGDALGKYTALVDWEIGHRLTGEDFCPRIAALTREAVDRVRGSLSTIRGGSPGSMESLMFALLLSGIAMQLWGNSRPASGCEHHLSHLWEMACLSPPTDALHGEKVGVGLLLALVEYRRIAALPRLEPRPGGYAGLPHGLLRQKFGGLYSDIAEENARDPLAGIDSATLKAALPGIGELLSGLPNPAETAAEMAAVGCLTALNQIGLSDAVIPDSLRFSPYVRNRLTFMRLRELLNT